MLFVDELAILSRYAHDEGAVVQGVSFCLGEGQSLAIVGESGSGKSMIVDAIAGVLAMRPDILILDDSSSALDYATDAQLRKDLKTLDTTTFIVAQRASSVRDADKIIVLDDGKAVGVGTHDELMRSCEVYREIYFSQYEAEGGNAV